MLFLREIAHWPPQSRSRSQRCQLPTQWHTKASPGKHDTKRMRNARKRHDALSLPDEMQNNENVLEFLTFLTQKNVLSHSLCVQALVVYCVFADLCVAFGAFDCIVAGFFFVCFQTQWNGRDFRSKTGWNFAKYEIPFHSGFRFEIRMEKKTKKRFSSDIARWCMIDHWILVFSLSKYFEREHLAVRQCTPLFRHCAQERPTLNIWIARKQKSLLFSSVLYLLSCIRIVSRELAPHTPLILSA